MAVALCGTHAMPNTTVQPISSAVRRCDVIASHVFLGDGTMKGRRLLGDTQLANSPTDVSAPTLFRFRGRGTSAVGEEDGTGQGTAELPTAGGPCREGGQKTPNAAADSSRGHPCEIKGDDSPLPGTLSTITTKPTLITQYSAPLPNKNSIYRVQRKKGKHESPKGGEGHDVVVI